MGSSMAYWLRHLHRATVMRLVADEQPFLTAEVRYGPKVGFGVHHPVAVTTCPTTPFIKSLNGRGASKRMRPVDESESYPAASWMQHAVSEVGCEKSAHCPSLPEPHEPLSRFPLLSATGAATVLANWTTVSGGRRCINNGIPKRFQYSRKPINASEDKTTTE